jgi:anti-sigma regulatory factor (Ser/Thr protein kinase)
MRPQTDAYAVGASASSGVLAAPSRWVTTRHVRLAALPSAVPWARRILRATLRERQLEGLLEAALLLVSELVTNAVQASARLALGDPGWLPTIALSLHITDTSLVTEVWDACPAVPALLRADLAGDRGRGLVLVDCLADAWGHRLTDGGKVVWCKLTVPHGPPAAQGGV